MPSSVGTTTSSTSRRWPPLPRAAPGRSRTGPEPAGGSMRREHGIGDVVEEEALDLRGACGGVDQRPACGPIGARLLGRFRPAFATTGHSPLHDALPWTRSRSRVAQAPVTHSPVTYVRQVAWVRGDQSTQERLALKHPHDGAAPRCRNSPLGADTYPCGWSLGALRLRSCRRHSPSSRGRRRCRRAPPKVPVALSVRPVRMIDGQRQRNASAAG